MYVLVRMYVWIKVTATVYKSANLPVGVAKMWIWNWGEKCDT